MPDATDNRTCPGVVQARVFGSFALLDSQHCAIHLSNRRAAAIIAILCLSSDRRVDRDTLSRLLWPGRFTAQAKASLRQCLHQLVRQLEELDLDILEVERSHITLRRGLLTSDLDALQSALADGRAREAATILEAIGSMPLLDDLALNGALREWLDARRVHFDAQIRAALLAIDTNRSVPDHTHLINAAQARFPALQPFRNITNKVTVAVLPFDQIDEVGGNFFLAEGVTDELSSQLGKVGAIALVGRTSIAAVAQRGETLTQMATSLRASHLVEGDVRRTPEHIEIRIALIEGASGTEVWADRITGSIEDFFDSRKVIGANITAALCRALGLPVSPAPMRRMTTDRAAYSLYLQGRSLIQRSMNAGAPAKAVELLEESLALDPDFAECWTALADAQIHNAVFTPCLDRVERSEMAAHYARKAVELDPGQGHALSIQGIHEWTRKNPAGALDLAFEGYAREPENADVAARLGSFLLYLGRTRQALPFVEAAVEQNPVIGRNYTMLTTAYFNLGEFEKAAAAGQRMVDLGIPGMWLAVLKAAAGEHEAAVADYYASRLLMNSVILPPVGTEPMNDQARDAYWMIAAKGCCSGTPEDRAMYCQMLTGLHATMPDPCDPSIVFPAIWMGHSELVMKAYRECIHPANMFGLMSLWADVEPLRRTRDHPDFMQFADDMGLVEAWNRHGWPDLMPCDPRAG